METIKTYIDNLFSSFPKTGEVLKAKEELLIMMEDKYNELKAKGKSESEAVGVVISEFGNIDELVKEWGLDQPEHSPIQKSEEKKSASYPLVDIQEAEIYIKKKKKISFYVSIGVMLCILSPVTLIFLTGMAEETTNFFLSESVASAIGLGVLLLLVAIAVAIFIITGAASEKYEYIKKGEFNLDLAAEQRLMIIFDENRISHAVHTTIGVMLCILGAVPLLVMSCIEPFEQDCYSVIGVSILLIVVSFAAALFIVGGNTKDCLNQLLRHDEYKVEKENSLADKVGGVYWPVIVVIYLGWSFVTGDWEITWIIWPIAAILFGAVTAICNIVTGKQE